MIIVTGATGRLGRRVVERLLERLPADQVGVSVREPAKARHLADRGVQVRRGDFAEPATLPGAFADAEQALLVSSDRFGEEALRLHRAAVSAAVRAGVGRVLYTSHQGAAADSLFAAMPDHAATEEVLAEAGVPWTSLRNGFYASTVQQLVGRARETGELRAPEDGPVSWTTHDDLAEAAAIVLAEPGRFDGPTPPLTAGQALDLADVAAILSESAGRAIRRVTVDDEDYVADLVGHGMPEPHARAMLGVFLASRRGEFAVVDPTLRDLLGRPPRSVRDLLTASSHSSGQAAHTT
ncbi:SDR family oxidoreductase [Actinokineospora sp. PR83]|uniref:SDR family oxidoreductase n=1 Tax=Actinokineospora sp. PR83 TaxID=2884908 RepID=UPI001F2DC94B|nr:SDR family oxidoreductase [Actinokineospora sp. PR83]MCG8915288.1 SDR family oxidoreductase [Actinokineospora sp. PR83]